MGLRLPAMTKPPIQAGDHGFGNVCLRLYRFIISLALPLLGAHALWLRLRGRMPRGALWQRLGLGWGHGAPQKPLLWVHGASNGELTSARWLLARLMAEHPGMGLLVTCNTDTARQMVLGWGMDGVQVAFAPFDSMGCVARFLAFWQPRALIGLENEIWPNRIALAAKRGPVMLVGARMSAGSARNWGRFAPGLMRKVLARLALVSAQDAGSETRLLGLGLAPGQLAPRLMLKSRLATPEARPAPFAPPFARARTLLAASTHDGEEALILRAFASARAQGGFDHLILAPRHPRRSAAVADLISAAGLTFATRSTGEVPTADTAVYLADTLGEMAHWYAMAGAVIIGGTFCDAGGHTPYEPASFGAALLHGPSVANFAESFAALDGAGAAIAVDDGPALTAALLTLDAERQQDLAARARRVLTPAGDEAALVAAISAQLAKAGL